MDSPAPPEEPVDSHGGPNLFWTPRIEREIEAWQRTGISSFQDTNLPSLQHFRGLSAVDLRLIHHLSTIYRDMHPADFVRCTVWVQMIPSFFDAAVGHDFVTSSVLAFSATHLGLVTGSKETKNLAYYHRGVALKGLHDAIGKFSRENSDPVLAASILLSWQAVDWGGWMSLMRGISSVVCSMRPWKNNSRFVSYIEDHPGLFSPKSVQPSSLSMDDESLFLATGALQRLSARLPNHYPSSQYLNDMLEFTKDIQTSSATMQSDQIFERLQPLRSWLFWMPVTLVQTNLIESSDMVLLAQLYTVALAVDSALPELGGAALGSLTIEAIQEIDGKLRYRQSTGNLGDLNTADLDGMMQFSRLMLERDRLENPVNHDTSQAQLHGQHSPYSFQHLSVGSQPGTPAGYPAGFSGAFSMVPNRSLEDLSTPASPFLRYGSPASQQNSQQYEVSPRLSDASFENRSQSAFSYRGDSPAYSPGYLGDEQAFTFGGRSPGYNNEFVPRKKTGFD